MNIFLPFWLAGGLAAGWLAGWLAGSLCKSQSAASSIWPRKMHFSLFAMEVASRPKLEILFETLTFRGASNA